MPTNRNQREQTAAALDGKQPKDADLTAIATATITADGLALLGLTVLEADDPDPTTPGLYLKKDS